MVAKHAVIFLRIFMYVYVCKYVYTHIHIYMYIYIFKDFICLLWERGREGEREWEKQQHSRDTSSGCLSHALNWGLDLNPGMCPDQESNQQPFGSQGSTQSTEPHQPGHMRVCIFIFIFIFVFILTLCISCSVVPSSCFQDLTFILDIIRYLLILHCKSKGWKLSESHWFVGAASAVWSFCDLAALLPLGTLSYQYIHIFLLVIVHFSGKEFLSAK